MPRNQKCRRVCQEPQSSVFMPEKTAESDVLLSVEELESIRLCDLETLDQDTASKRMGVSRGTFQRILYSARQKIADALVNAKCIRIGGGNYEVAERPCDCEMGCRQCRFAHSEERQDCCQKHKEM